MAELTVDIKTPFGVVDMGSNGIRFGIITALVRHLPVAYEERAPISLLDAQGDEHVIPEETIELVITSFLRFKLLCEHAGVQMQHVKVIATEATRIAHNATDFLQRIYEHTQWKVDILSKEQEAMLSTLGVVGSFDRVNGLVMDLGGGSVELSHVRTLKHAGQFQAAASPVSLPFGAAVLKNRLIRCNTASERQMLYQEIVEHFQRAKAQVQVPEDLHHPEGYTVYMSGGGFRALAYLSMAAGHQSQPSSKRRLAYPIPIVHGYNLSGEELLKLAKRYMDRQPEELVRELCVFRISKRRAAMIPAACFLVSAIMQVVPIRRVFFSEGGVRQGFCYHLLAPAEQAKDPLLEEVKQHASQSPHALSPTDYHAIYKTLLDAIPRAYLQHDHPLQLHRLLPVAVHLSNMTSHYPKGTRAFVAFHMPLAGGSLANVCGITHRERALLALMLAFRHGGEIPDPIFDAVQAMMGEKALAVCRFVGRLMELVFAVTPLRPELGLTNSGITFQTVPVEGSMMLVQGDENVCTKDHTEDEHYKPARLRVILPSQPCPQVDAPVVMSVIQSMDKRVNLTTTCGMDENQSSFHRSVNLFSVDISRR
ncbi:hypothetical protein DFQ28_009643 [Apophysomyces sp. BC1034]|nr:hypothetical protein DFQ30_009390 [Apophysomyces sp. BC1015]KAG0172480.1 hypothetical protein DFQ29_008349 [Apophysomyces sp. BC1021]KAG0185254.1 hypothetical protein DFQ28_009643 [Apophysomyces sp. BC1034]